MHSDWSVLTLETCVQQLCFHDGLIREVAVLLYYLPHLISEPHLLVFVLGQQEGREGQQRSSGIIAGNDEQYALRYQRYFL